MDKLTNATKLKHWSTVINEIIALSEFFGVSADYIIKGEKFMSIKEH